MGWVARMREPSAFEIKLPIRSTHTIRPTKAVVVSDFLLDVESILASSSCESLECTELGCIWDSLAEVSLDEILTLLADEVLAVPDSSGVRSVL